MTSIHFAQHSHYWLTRDDDSSIPDGHAVAACDRSHVRRIGPLTVTAHQRLSPPANGCPTCQIIAAGLTPVSTVETDDLGDPDMDDPDFLPAFTESERHVSYPPASYASRRRIEG